MSRTALSVEDRLFQNRYRVDAGRQHIQIAAPDVRANDYRDQTCTFVCPAGCYTAEGNRTVSLATDGCLECGSCRVICTEHRNVVWEYPRGNHVILFKFG